MTKAKFSHVCFPRGHHLYNVVVQLLSHIWLFATPWTPVQQDSLSFTISLSLLKLMSNELVMPSNCLILYTPFSSCLQFFPASGVFSNELALCIRWPKYWSFSFSTSPSSEQSGLISFRMDLFDLCGIQATLKTLLQPHSLKASVLWCSVSFMVQLSHLYMTTGKTIALTIRNFVSKVMFLLFNKLSRFVKAFLPMSKCLLTLWL